jgi:hypothetical protein
MPEEAPVINAVPRGFVELMSIPSGTPCQATVRHAAIDKPKLAPYRGVS